MKNIAKVIILLSIVVGVVSYYYFRTPSPQDVKKMLVDSPALKKFLVRVENSSESSSVAQDLKDLEGSESNFTYKTHEDYFKDVILKNPSAKELYQKALNILGNNPEAGLVAEFIAGGVAREDTHIFAQYFRDLLSDLNAGNKDVADLIISKEKLLQENKFQYQMVLNMAFVMSLPVDTKTRILGGALLRPFTYAQDGSISPESTNISNALILLKNSQLPQDKIFAFIRLGMTANKRNPAALREFHYRANAYFPEMIDVLKD